MSHLSGWCTAPEGARPQHEKCRSPWCLCGCGCAERNAGNPAVERDSRSEVHSIGGVARYDGGTNQDGPRQCVNTVVPGASPTDKESTSA